MAQWLNGSMAQWLNGSMAQWLAVCLLTGLAATLSNAVVAEEDKPFDIDLVPTNDKDFDRDVGTLPTYVEEDELGRLFASQIFFREDGSIYTEKAYLSKTDIADMEAAGFWIKIVSEVKDSEKPVESVNRSTNSKSLKAATCPMASGFSIFKFGSNIIGNNILGTNVFNSTNRPSGTQTQWLQYDFQGWSLANEPVHTPNFLFYTRIYQSGTNTQIGNHGWGMFWGNNTLHPRACTSPNVTMNTQIEAWSAHPGCTGTGGCQSNVYNVGGSCGATGTSTNNNRLLDNQRYRLSINASTGHWVAYGVDNYISPNVYTSRYSWRALQVEPAPTSNSWSFPPNVNLNANQTGIAVLMSGSPLNGSTNWGNIWHASFSNVDCGWI